MFCPLSKPIQVISFDNSNNSTNSFTPENLNVQDSLNQILPSIKHELLDSSLSQSSSVQKLLSFSTKYSPRSTDIYYAFNVLPISLKFIENKDKFSFLTELGRKVDFCELSSETLSVHMLLDDIFMQPNIHQTLGRMQPSDEKHAVFAQKLQASAVAQSFSSQPGNIPHIPFYQRAKKQINNFFATKKDKRIFALAGSLQNPSSRHSFSLHFTEAMIHSLGFQPDQFMLKCSLTGFTEFFLRNDFISNMDAIVSGLLKHFSQFPASQTMEPVKIRQKFCKHSDEAMEAMFAVYLLPGEQTHTNTNIQVTTESILIFEILHILDFQVANKGKKFAAKKRSFDCHESSFLERYLKSLNYLSTSSSSACSFEDSSCNSPLDSSNKASKSVGKRRKPIAKSQKQIDSLRQNKKRRN